MVDASSKSSPALSILPADELAHYARDLGLDVDASWSRTELLRQVRNRQELLVELSRDALLDVVVWARIPVRQSASVETLVKKISGLARYRFDGLSDRGLRAVGRLRGLTVGEHDSRETIERKIRRQESLWKRLQRKRRAAVGSFLTTLVEGTDDASTYQFLPEDQGRTRTSLKESIEHDGVVGGIAKKLRGAADEYLYEKLEEIEQRIDAKLGQIDDRLAIWRDQEVANRLRIVKITLIASIVVAIISLGYNYLKPPAAQTGPNVTAKTPVSMDLKDH